MVANKKQKSDNRGGSKIDKSSSKKSHGNKPANSGDKKTSKNDKSVKRPESATSKGKSPGAKGNKSPKSGKKSPKGTKSSPGNKPKRHKSTTSKGSRSPKGNAKSSDKKPSGTTSGKKSPKGTKSSPSNKAKRHKSTTSKGSRSPKGNAKSSDKKPSGTKGNKSPKSGKKSPKGTKISPGDKTKRHKSTTSAGSRSPKGKAKSSDNKPSGTKGNKSSKSGKKSPNGTNSSSDNKTTTEHGEKLADTSTSADGNTSKHGKKTEGTSKQKAGKIEGNESKDDKKNRKENKENLQSVDGVSKDDSKPSNDKKQEADKNPDAWHSKKDPIGGETSKKDELSKPQKDGKTKKTDKSRKKSFIGKENKTGEKTAEGDKVSKEKNKKDESKRVTNTLALPSGDAQDIGAAPMDVSEGTKKTKTETVVERRDSTESVVQDEQAFPKNQNAKTWSSTIQDDSAVLPGNNLIVPSKITPPRATRETEKVDTPKEKRETKRHAASPVRDMKSAKSRFATENQPTTTRVRSSITNRYPIIPGVLLQTFSKFGIPGVNVINLSKSKASAGDSSVVASYTNQDKPSERPTMPTNEHVLYEQSYAPGHRSTVASAEPTYNLPTQSTRINSSYDTFRAQPTTPHPGYSEYGPTTWNRPRTAVDSTSKFSRPPNFTESMTGQSPYKRMYGSISQRNPQIDTAASFSVMDANTRQATSTEPISMYDKHINAPTEPLSMYDKRMNAPQQFPQAYDTMTQKIMGDANGSSMVGRPTTVYNNRPTKVAPNVNGDSIYDRLNSVSTDGCVKGSITNRFPYMQPNVILSAANSIDQSGRLALALSKSGVQGQSAQKMLTQMGRNPGRTQQPMPFFGDTVQQEDARPRSNSIAEKVLQIQTGSSSDGNVPLRLPPTLDSPSAITKAQSVPNPALKVENYSDNVPNNKNIRRNSVSEKILQFQSNPPSSNRDMDNTSNGLVIKPPKATKYIVPSTQAQISSSEKPPRPVQAWGPRDPLKDNFINININIDKNNANQNMQAFNHSNYFPGDNAANQLTVNHPGTMVNVASSKPPIPNYLDATSYSQQPQNGLRSKPLNGSPTTNGAQTNWNTNARHSTESLKSCSDETVDMIGRDRANCIQLVDLPEGENSNSQKQFMATRTNDDDIMGSMHTVVSYAYQLVNALCTAMEDDIQKQLIPSFLLCDRCPGDEPCVHTAAEAMSLRKQTTGLIQEVSDLVRPQITLSMVQTVSTRCRDIQDVYEKLDSEIFKIVHTVLFEVSQSKPSNLGTAIAQHMVKHSSLALKKTKFNLLEM